MAQQREELAHRAARRVNRVRLIPPDRRAIQPVTANNKLHQRRNGKKNPPGQTPRSRGLSRKVLPPAGIVQVPRQWPFRQIPWLVSCGGQGHGRCSRAGLVSLSLVTAATPAYAANRVGRRRLPEGRPPRCGVQVLRWAGGRWVLHREVYKASHRPGGVRRCRSTTFSPRPVIRCTSPVRAP
jgi:hypothetical protein